MLLLPTKFIDRLKWHLKELNKTFSHEPSHYSSKRIERMVLFISANYMLWWMVQHLMAKDKLDWMGAIGIYTAQMVYAGFQTKNIMKDVENNVPNTEKTA